MKWRFDLESAPGNDTPYCYGVKYLTGATRIGTAPSPLWASSASITMCRSTAGFISCTMAKRLSRSALPHGSPSPIPLPILRRVTLSS